MLLNTVPLFRDKFMGGQNICPKLEKYFQDRVTRCILLETYKCFLNEGVVERLRKSLQQL